MMNSRSDWTIIQRNISNYLCDTVYAIIFWTAFSNADKNGLYKLYSLSCAYFLHSLFSPNSFHLIFSIYSWFTFAAQNVSVLNLVFLYFLFHFGLRIYFLHKRQVRVHKKLIVCSCISISVHVLNRAMVLISHPTDRWGKLCCLDLRASVASLAPGAAAVGADGPETRLLYESIVFSLPHWHFAEKIRMRIQFYKLWANWSILEDLRTLCQ